MNGAYLGKWFRSELIEWFCDRYVDVDGAEGVVCTFEQSFVDETVAMPLFRCVVTFWKRHTGFCHLSEDVGLWKGLSVHLSDPCCGTVSRKDDEGYLLVEGFANSRVQIGQSRTGCDAYCYGVVGGQCDTYSIETCASFVGNGVAMEESRLTEGVTDGSVAAARAEYYVMNAVLV